jgi:hypothetical protein
MEMPENSGKGIPVVSGEFRRFPAVPAVSGGFRRFPAVLKKNYETSAV